MFFLSVENNLVLDLHVKLDYFVKADFVHFKHLPFKECVLLCLKFKYKCAVIWFMLCKSYHTVVVMY